MTWPPRSSFQVSEARPVKPKYVLAPQILGSGASSEVRECKHITSKAHYAAKVIPKIGNLRKIQLIQNEFRILSIAAQKQNINENNLLDGRQFLLKLHDYFETADKFFLITDLCIGGDLFDKIVNDGYYKKEVDARNLMNSMVSGLLFLKSHQTIHRDIKAENIFFKSNNTKLDIVIGDFGLSMIQGSTAEENPEIAKMVCGTLSYMAPEMLDKKPYSYGVDVWSLGVLMYFMLCGYMPFDCQTEEETKEAIRTADFMFEPVDYWTHVSDDTRKIISSCFEVDEKKRATLEELHDHLSRPVQAFSPILEAAELADEESSVLIDTVMDADEHEETVQVPDDLLRQLVAQGLNIQNKNNSFSSKFNLPHHRPAIYHSQSHKSLQEMQTTGFVIPRTSSLTNFTYKMNGAYSEEPMVLADFRAASLFQGSKLVSAYNSVSPSRLGSAKASQTVSRTSSFLHPPYIRSRKSIS